MAAEMFLSAVISLLTNKAADLVLGEFRTARSVEKDCQKLYRILPAVQAVVENAEERSRAELAVREWLHSLKAAAHEAEDVLDELKYDAIRKAIKTEIQSERKVPLCLLQRSVFKNNILRSYSDGKRLKGVLDKIDALVAEMNQFGFLRTLQQVPAVVSRPRTHSYVVESTIIGRNDDLENIVVIILSQAKSGKITVLPIVGMGGLGKTTLAQLVYNNSVIRSRFELKLWVCVSEEFDVARIAKAIIDVAGGGNSNLPLDNMEVIQQRLREVLCKRYLLVLDDVWNENPSKWDQLKLLLDCGNTTGVVIVTTRSEKVALIVGTVGAYNLQGLDEHHLWGIFRLKAFPMATDEHPELVEIGKQLMKKCCGSPLVATTLGALMSYKKEKREWLDVLESKNLIVENEIMPVLKLSFENLPSYIKRCFTFCAVYPKDYVMERDTLIQLWMANSYIPSDENIEIEAKGIEIFNELAWRGFLQDVKRDKLDGTISCKMHDLIHDLARSFVGKTCISFLNSDPQSVVLSKETIHVFYSNIDDTCWSLIGCSSVHSLLFFQDHFMYGDHNRLIVPLDLSKARSCRALSLRGISIEDIHVEPRSLKHLRWLDFLNCSRLKVLPGSLCTLYNLQILKLTGCSNLKYLPENMSHMHSLRHLYLDGCYLERMLAALGKLRCLQTLTQYIVDPAIGCSIEELKDLNLGGTLTLYGLEKLGNQQEAKLANLTSKTNLIELKFLWPDHSVDPTSARDILDGLEPYRGLEVLTIEDYNGIEFAKWMCNSAALRNLTHLSLWWCKQITTLPPIWQLPSLKQLLLVGLGSLKYICSGNALLAQGQASHKFSTLQELRMHDLVSLERWQENDSAEQTSLTLPQIRELRIWNCPKLDVLPSCPLIEELILYNLDNLKHICSGGSTQLVPMFLVLRRLQLLDLSSLERWQENDPTEQTYLTLPQIRELTIRNCHKLDALSSCPLIEELILYNLDNLKHICSGGSTQLVPMFPVLRRLQLSDLSSLKRWQENDPAERTSLALPQLSFLNIWSCPRLNALPSCPKLVELGITGRTNIPSSIIESFKNQVVAFYFEESDY